MNRAFWKGKRVFITGHTGFKGSWLCLWLQSLGAELTGYALSPATKPNMYEATRVEKNMHSIIGDVRDYSRLKQALQDANPEIVIHLAAQPLVRASYKDPLDTYSTNVMGTVNFLEAVRHTPSVKASIVVTSDKCYENKEWVWGYREDEPMGGHDPYSNSKGCAELVTSAYRTSYFNSKIDKSNGTYISSARAGNVIGGGDWSGERLIPDIIKALENRNKVYIRNPNAIRPWQYVLDLLKGYLMLAEKLYNEGQKYSESWNFGPTDNEVKKVSWIVEYLSSSWGNDFGWAYDSTEHPHEANYLKLDSSKSNQRLGWRQSVDLTTTLDRIVQWHKLFIKGADMRDETLKEIKHYERGLN